MTSVAQALYLLTLIVYVQTENTAAILWGSGVSMLKVSHDDNACVQLLDE
jgi:hypothetical protein